MATADVLHFAGEAFVWRGPAPYVFVAVPDLLTATVRDAACTASYGWGVVPVIATIGSMDFTTSLFPKEGGYLLPLKLAVRRALDIAAGDQVSVLMRVVPRQA